MFPFDEVIMEIDLVIHSQKLVYISSYAKIAGHHYIRYHPEYFDRNIWILNESRFNVVRLIVCYTVVYFQSPGAEWRIYAPVVQATIASGNGFSIDRLQVFIGTDNGVLLFV